MESVSHVMVISIDGLTANDYHEQAESFPFLQQTFDMVLIKLRIDCRIYSVSIVILELIGSTVYCQQMSVCNIQQMLSVKCHVMCNMLICIDMTVSRDGACSVLWQDTG